MKEKGRRRPLGYDGCSRTSKLTSELLTEALQEIRQKVSDRPDLVLAEWPQVIGPKLAPMTEAISFTEGILRVKVKNSTLYSLLSQREKERLLASFRNRFPRTAFFDIVFRMS